MGILDEAIRSHLDLKRRHGAAEDDLRRLEDEAFGPPTRPGEPDFPEQEANGEGELDADAELDGPTGAAEAEVLPAEEPPSAEHAVLEPETAEGPEAEAVESTQAAEAASGEQEAAEPGAGEPAGFFDQAGDELDLAELDLELDAEEAQVEEELAAELEEDEFAELGEPEAPEDRPEPAAAIESLPTEEHPAEIDSAEEGEEEVDDDEDVLADTPDFLKDAPEDDELWFEQGKPKDFDFDE